MCSFRPVGHLLGGAIKKVTLACTCAVNLQQPNVTVSNFPSTKVILLTYRVYLLDNTKLLYILSLGAMILLVLQLFVLSIVRASGYEFTV